MNFYSENIINDIIDTSEVSEILDNIEEFRKLVFILFCKYSFSVIHYNYILSLLKDQTNKIAFRCMDTNFDVNNCPSMLIYQEEVCHETEEIKYYILMICTKPKFKKYGYASSLLNDFIESIRTNKICKSSMSKFKKTIILSSIESAVTFYEKYGFRWLKHASLPDYPILIKYEKFEEDKEYFILELNI